MLASHLLAPPLVSSQGQYCDICSKGDSDRAHPITNAIDGTERWWQSPPLSRSTEYNEVNVTLDLGQVGRAAVCSLGSALEQRLQLVFASSSRFGKGLRDVLEPGLSSDTI